MNRYCIVIWPLITLLADPVFAGQPKRNNHNRHYSVTHQHPRKFIHKKHTRPSPKKNAVNLHEPLDLRLSSQWHDFKDPHPSIPQQSSENSIFAGSYNKEQRLQLKGQVVMSQEPEADKRKSVDGAGILINIKQ